MDRTESVTLTNMCMITNADKILVLNRVDPNWPGLTFPGGHIEAHESITESVIREVQEETNLTITQPKLVGVKQFYDAEHHRYLVFFYRANQFSGELKSSREGNLKWLTKEELLQSPLAPNFDHDLPLFFDEQFNEHLLDGQRDVLF
ncbi:8-oxo-dGTP diphosphatase [Bombilactobacillus thymidiniphilus]|uniref:8-oxo-dGTP diphosphatase n=1 Tax=Bombilactobacillus thymidiniphilus TaxID=2923363 RepID=A0ABY4PDT0_9LACO|nr:8-oxo-dGTP diphosphatase [Bombilactobacillus thymidiniphilus]UQS83598.1 8-oxo-dGTP diphosphatase [Bombilactobacillus thymidiniphilus]UQS83649.1 8-oxo-dGTP diphosphatase [Bombilactobacillus thymidiniphilus]